MEKEVEIHKHFRENFTHERKEIRMHYECNSQKYVFIQKACHTAYLRAQFFYVLKLRLKVKKYVCYVIVRFRTGYSNPSNATLAMDSQIFVFFLFHLKIIHWVKSMKCFCERCDPVNCIAFR